MTGNDETDLSDQDSDWTDDNSIDTDTWNAIFESQKNSNKNGKDAVHPKPGAATGSTDPNPRSWHSMNSIIIESDNVPTNDEPVWDKDDMLDELVRMDPQQFDDLSIDDLDKYGVMKPEVPEHGNMAARQPSMIVATQEELILSRRNVESMTAEEMETYTSKQLAAIFPSLRVKQQPYVPPEPKNTRKKNRLTDDQRIQAYTLLEVRKKLMNSKDIVTISKSKRDRFKFKKSYMSWGHKIKLFDIQKSLGGKDVISHARLSKMSRQLSADDFTMENVNSRAKQHGNNKRQLYFSVVEQALE